MTLTLNILDVCKELFVNTNMDSKDIELTRTRTDGRTDNETKQNIPHFMGGGEQHNHEKLRVIALSVAFILVAEIHSIHRKTFRKSQ